MKSKVITFCSVLLLTAVHAAAQEASPEKETPPAGGTPKSFQVPATRDLTLKNGMTVTLIPYGSVPKVLISAVVRSGNYLEGPNQAWLADLTGRMLKEGTRKRTAAQVAEQAAAMGGSLDVQTLVEQTFVECEVLSEFGPEAAELLADVLMNARLPEAELERNRNDMLRDLAISMTQADNIARNAFLRTLYPNQPHGRLFPTEEELRSYTMADIRAFHQKGFTPAATRIFVAGKFDAAMEKAMRSAFEGWKGGARSKPVIPKPVAGRTLELIDRPDAPQTTLYVGLPVVAPEHADYIPLQVLNSLLGGSFASRITTNIREQKGYTYSPYSSVSANYRGAHWVQVADVTTKDTGASLREIFSEIETLRREPPPAKELQGIQNYMAGLFVIRNSSRSGLVRQLAYVDLHGLPRDYLRTYVQKVLAVTPQQVQSLAEKYLAPSRMAIVAVGDKKTVETQLKPYTTESQQ
jgi:zinc protease